MTVSPDHENDLPLSDEDPSSEASESSSEVEHTQSDPLSGIGYNRDRASSGASGPTGSARKRSNSIPSTPTATQFSVGKGKVSSTFSHHVRRITFLTNDSLSSSPPNRLASFEVISFSSRSCISVRRFSFSTSACVSFDFQSNNESSSSMPWSSPALLIIFLPHAFPISFLST